MFCSPFAEITPEKSPLNAPCRLLWNLNFSIVKSLFPLLYRVNVSVALSPTLTSLNAKLLPNAKTLVSSANILLSIIKLITRVYASLNIFFILFLFLGQFAKNIFYLFLTINAFKMVLKSSIWFCGSQTLTV